jgi:hypothetical protein
MRVKHLEPPRLVNGAGRSAANSDGRYRDRTVNDDSLNV